MPLYIVLMFFLPLILRLMKWRADVTLPLSVALYVLAWQYDLHLTSYPNGFWAFNPFFWQLLFVFGAWCALGGASGCRGFCSSPITQWIALAYLLAAFCVTMTWYFPQLGFLMPRRLEQWIYPIEQDRSRCAPIRAFSGAGGDYRAIRAEWLAGIEIALAEAH